MADKSTSLILEALGRAAAEPNGLALHGGRGVAGLFAVTAAAKQAAQHCREQGYLRVVRTESRGKATQEICAITEKGLAFLLSQVSPRQVLEDFIRALEGRQGQIGELLDSVRTMQVSLDALKTAAEKVLQQVHKADTVGHEPSGNGCDTWVPTVLSYLARWQESGAPEDCLLPDLYRQARQAAPSLTIGHFHDGLRRMHEREQIYLHPWTGPLYDIPEPPYALLVGHEIAYYASLRK